MKSEKMSYILFVVLCASITGCGKPLAGFYNELKKYGYIAYTTPLQFANTGTLVGGNPNSLSIIANPETCFPSQVNGEPTNLRFLDESTLPSTSQSITVDTSLQADLFKVLQVGFPSIKAKVKLKEVSKIQLDFEGVHIEYMDAILLGEFYKNHMNMTCKNYLNKVAFIIQAIKVDKMRFQFYSLNSGLIQLSVEKIQQFLDLSGSVEWSIEKNTSLIINTPKYIGYQLGSLRTQDNGLALYRATKSILNKFIFKPLNLFPDVKSNQAPLENTFSFDDNPDNVAEQDLDSHQLESTYNDDNTPDPVDPADQNPTPDNDSSSDRPKDRKDF